MAPYGLFMAFGVVSTLTCIIIFTCYQFTHQLNTWTLWLIHPVILISCQLIPKYLPTHSLFLPSSLSPNNSLLILTFLTSCCLIHLVILLCCHLVPLIQVPTAWQLYWLKVLSWSTTFMSLLFGHIIMRSTQIQFCPTWIWSISPADMVRIFTDHSPK